MPWAFFTVGDPPDAVDDCQFGEVEQVMEELESEGVSCDSDLPESLPPNTPVSIIFHP